MRTVKIVPMLRKVRVKNQNDIYYTYSHWQAKEIDGVMFVPVNKNIPANEKMNQVLYLRKDWLEYVK